MVGLRGPGGPSSLRSIAGIYLVGGYAKNPRLPLKALDAEESPPQLAATRDAIFAEVGTIQLPELMLGIFAQRLEKGD